MSQVLSSWKEIASYLGKGVRTVQRWETGMGLPVRRPRPKSSGVVLAFSDELDDWLRGGARRHYTNHSAQLAQMRSLLVVTMEQTRLVMERTEQLRQYAARQMDVRSRSHSALSNDVPLP
jgi:hypothetical protein